MKRTFAIHCIIYLLLFSGGSHASCTDPISCYLNSVVIPIPDFFLPVPPGILYITNLTCYNPIIQAVPSSYIPPTSINVVVDNFSISCSGLFTYLLTAGTVSIDLSDATLNVTTTVVNEAEYPTAFLVPHCSASAGNIDIVFKGNAGSGLLNLLASALVAFLEKASSVLVCSVVTQALEVNGTQALQTLVDPALHGVVEAAAAPVPVFGSEMVDWQEVNQLLNSGLACLTLHHPHVADRLQRPAVNLLVDLVTRGSGEAVMPLNQTLTLGNSSTLRLNSLSVRGLDSFSDVLLFAPVAASNVTILSSAFLVQLVVQLNITYEWSGGDGPYSQALVLDLSLANSTLAATTVLALSKSLFGSLYLDQLLQPSCLLQTVAALSVSSLTLATTVGTAALTQTAGGSAAQPEKDVAGLLDTALLLAMHGFGPLLSGLVSGLVQGTLRPLIDEELSAALAAAQSDAPCTHAVDDGPAIIVWSNSSLVRATDAVLDQLLGAQGLNALLRCATNGTGAAQLYSDAALSMGVRGLDSLRYLAVAEALPDSTCAGRRPLEQSTLAPFQPPQPLPPHPYDLSSRVGVGACSSAPLVGCSPLYLDISYTLHSRPRGWRFNGTSFLGNSLRSWATVNERSSSSSSWNGRNLFGPILNVSTVQASGNSSAMTVHASLGAADLFLFANSALQVSAALAADLRLNQLLQPGCLAATVESLVVLQLSAQASAVSLQLSVSNGTNVSSSFSTVTPVDVSKQANLMFHALSGAPALALLNRAVDHRLAGANSTCTDSSGGDVVSDDTAAVDSGSASGFDYAYWATPVAIILAMAVAALVVRVCLPWYGKNVHDYLWGDKVQVDSGTGDRMVLLTPQVSMRHYRWNESMLMDSRLSLRRRLVLLLLVGVYTWLITLGIQDPDSTTIYVRLQAGGQSKLVNFYSLGVVETLQDMWLSGSYLLFLVGAFSAVWSYIKTFLMLLCMALPPELLSPQSRGWALAALECTAKATMANYFISVFFSAVFYLQVTPAPGISAQSFVQPQPGTFYLMVGTSLFYVVGNGVLAAHRRLVYGDVEGSQNGASDGHLESPLTHVYEVFCSSLPLRYRPSGALLFSSLGLRVTGRGRAALGLLLALTSVMVVLGAYFDSLVYLYVGLVGLLLQDADTVQYSLVSLGIAYPDTTGSPDSIGFKLCQFYFFLYGLGTTLALLIMLGYLWHTPLPLRRQRHWVAAADMLHVWSNYEVYGLSVLGVFSQIPLFVIGDMCDGINVLLAEYLDEQLNGNDVCFQVNSFLAQTSWLLLIGSGMLIATSAVSLWLFSVVLEERRVRLCSDRGTDYEPFSPFSAGSTPHFLASAVLETSDASHSELKSPLLMCDNSDTTMQFPNKSDAGLGSYSMLPGAAKEEGEEGLSAVLQLGSTTPEQRLGSSILGRGAVSALLALRFVRVCELEPLHKRA